MTWTGKILSALLLPAFLAGASPCSAKIPDPDTSTCELPIAVPCNEPVPVLVTLRDAFGLPVAACTTSVSIVVESGALAEGQESVVTGITDEHGFVDLTFPDGIRGQATIRFAVECFLYGQIPICESDPVGLGCMPAVGVGDSWQSDPWGQIKARYR